MTLFVLMSLLEETIISSVRICKFGTTFLIYLIQNNLPAGVLSIKTSTLTYRKL